MTLTPMTTAPVSWTITAVGSDTVTAAAHAPDHTAAWTDALRAARTALLTGDLDTLAVTIGNNHCGALYTETVRICGRSSTRRGLAVRGA
jgi:hypothetical protein